MTRPAQGLLGGAQAAITTAAVAVNLTAFVGRSVMIWSDDAALWFTFGDGTSTTLVTAGASAASTTSLKADRVAQGEKIARLVHISVPYLIVAAVTGSGTVHVKLVSDVDGCDAQGEVSSGVPATVSGTMTATQGTASAVAGAWPVKVTDGTNTAAVKAASTAPSATDPAAVVVLSPNTPQLPPVLGPTTAAGSLSTVPGITKTDNPTYISNASMAADVTGAAITVGARGLLEAYVSWTSASSQVGTISLQALAPDGTTWFDIPGASVQFITQPNSNTAAYGCLWSGLEIYTSVRIKYTRASGGAAGNNFSVQTRTA